MISLFFVFVLCRAAQNVLVQQDHMLVQLDHMLPTFAHCHYDLLL